MQKGFASVCRFFLLPTVRAVDKPFIPEYFYRACHYPRHQTQCEIRDGQDPPVTLARKHHKEGEFSRVQPILLWSSLARSFPPIDPHEAPKRADRTQKGVAADTVMASRGEIVQGRLLSLAGTQNRCDWIRSGWCPTWKHQSLFKAVRRSALRA